MKNDGVQYVLGSRCEDLPRRELSNAVSGLINRKRARNLARDCNEEFLQHLDAEASRAALPQAGYQLCCRYLFGAGRGIEGVYEHIRVNKFSYRVSVHGVRRETKRDLHQCRVIGLIAAP